MSNCPQVDEIEHLWRGPSLWELGWFTVPRGWSLAGICEVPPAKSSFQQTVTAGSCLTLEKYRRSPHEGPIVWSQRLFLASGLLLYRGVISSGCWGGHSLGDLPWYSRITSWVLRYRRSASLWALSFMYSFLLLMLKILVVLGIFNYIKSGHSDTVRLCEEKQKGALTFRGSLFINEWIYAMQCSIQQMTM